MIQCVNQEKMSYTYSVKGVTCETATVLMRQRLKGAALS